jgi:hypothetical protein
MNGPCRRHGVINRAELADRHGSKEHDLELNHTVPYRTGLFSDTSLAINCQATFIQSLRDT